MSKILDHLLHFELLEEGIEKEFERIENQISYQGFKDGSYKFALKIEHQNIILNVTPIKGSILTYCWNKFVRFDEEIECTIHPSDSNKDKEILWYLSGTDYLNNTIKEGKINWDLMRKIKTSFEINSIGLHSFAKIFGRIVIFTPLFSLTQTYLLPMPISFMYNYTIIVESCPIEISVYSKSVSLVQKTLEGLNFENGKAPWIQGYHPYWNESGNKELCSEICLLQNKRPIKVSQTNKPSKMRLIEIIETELSSNRFIAVVELVSEEDWSQFIRFVVIEFERLINNMKGIENNEEILLFDEIKWNEFLVDNIRNLNASRSNKKILFTSIDFRNSSCWGNQSSSELFFTTERDG